MSTDAKSREQLKPKFKANAVPKEGDFVNLIDAALNQVDDGIAKTGGTALRLEASTSADTTSPNKTAIKFFELPSDPKPAWVLSLADTTGAKGFTLSDGAGNRRLFIADTGTTIGALTATGHITANEGLTVGQGKTLTANGPVNANAGLTVTSPNLTISSAGGIVAAGLIEANRGLTVPSGQNLTLGVGIGSTQTTLPAKLCLGTELANTKIALYDHPGVLYGFGIGSLQMRLHVGSTTARFSFLAGSASNAPEVMTIYGDGRVNVAGNLEAKNGATVTGAALNVGTSTADAQDINAWGAIYAKRGATVTGAALNVEAGADKAAIKLYETFTDGLNENPAWTLGLADPNGAKAFTLSNGEGYPCLLITGDPGSEMLSVACSGSLGSHPGGIRLNGTDQLVRLPSTGVDFSGGFTIQAWIYLHSFPKTLEGAYVIRLSSDDIGRRISFVVNTDGSLCVRYDLSGNNMEVKTEANLLTTATWIHVAVTVGDGVAKLYKNGSLIAEAPMVLPDPIYRNQNFIGLAWNGWLREVSLWVGVRNVTASTLQGSEDGLVGYWKLNDDSDTTTADSCKNGNRIGDGTLQQGARTSSGFALAWDSPEDRVTIKQANILQASIGQEMWITPALSNGWIQYPDATYNIVGFFKDSCGVVHLRGCVKGGALNEAILVLPGGYRPEFCDIFMVFTSSPPSITPGRLEIRSTGEVMLMAGSRDWVSLDGISFRAYS